MSIGSIKSLGQNLITCYYMEENNFSQVKVSENNEH